MFATNLYYSIKPFVPWSIRMAVRRWFAVRKRPKVERVWPIYPGSETPPPGWSGWPAGKQFALVLTHDVEGPAGLAKCRALMELEMRLGFRSSFNFIPEGTYRVSPELREELVHNGFEVGVHDLHHDGKLYRDRDDFRRKAARINHYLRAWGAMGFRSGFMRRNFDWLHDLEIAYDTSSFDTDPFEPQPDGVHTIFPFWVPRPDAERSPGGSGERRAEGTRSESKSGNPKSEIADGYVELPYTLAQDSTLYSVFQERSIEVWIRKLDWIVEHGGMALVNVHPDYLAMAGPETGKVEYSVRLYTEFLRQVMTDYRAECWHATPSEVAKWCSAGPSTAHPVRRQLWGDGGRKLEAAPGSQSSGLCSGSNSRCNPARV